MQNNKYRRCLQMLLISLIAAFGTVSCIKEDLTQCYASVEVKALDADNITVGSDIVKDVKLYIFDKNKIFIDSCQANLEEKIILNNFGEDKLHVVAWGNSSQGNQTIPKLKKGNHLDDAFVSLIKTTKAELPLAASPDDLFYGTAEIETAKSSVQTILIKRKISSVVITARYLKEFVRDTDGEFQYVLRKSSSKLDFYGLPNGEDISYTPSAGFDSSDDFVSSVFNIFPTDNDLRIDIYHRGILKATIKSDSQGKPLRVVEGKLLNVLINFRLDINVYLSVTPWGEKQIWKEL